MCAIWRVKITFGPIAIYLQPNAQRKSLRRNRHCPFILFNELNAKTQSAQIPSRDVVYCKPIAWVVYLFLRATCFTRDVILPLAVCSCLPLGSLLVASLREEKINSVVVFDQCPCVFQR